MFKRQDYTFLSNPLCMNPVEDLSAEDFQYYDKDGFELNHAEQKFYRAAKFPVNTKILNHTCWQEPWFVLEPTPGLILDHSMFLCRAAYAGKAQDQLKALSKDIPQASLLLNTKVKWGFDFALDAVRDEQLYEVLHIEYDSRNFDHFSNALIKFEYLIRHTDWVDAAEKVWLYKHEWQHLKGFEQNHWKAKFLIGWDLAEYTEKSI